MAGQATKKTGQAPKAETIESLKQSMQASTVTIVADYRGMTVEHLTAIRRDLFPLQARFTVAKNSLMKLAVKGTDAEAISNLLTGPTAILFATADQVQPVKALKKFLKERKLEIELRGGFMDGRALSSKEIDELANLPSLDELRAKLLGCIASPLNGLVGALSSQQRGLVNVLDQYAKTKSQD